MKIDSLSLIPDLPPFFLFPSSLPERRKFVVRVKTATVGLIRQVERRGKYSPSLHFRELLKLLLDNGKEMVLQNVGFVCQQIYTGLFCARNCILFFFLEEEEIETA